MIFFAYFDICFNFMKLHKDIPYINLDLFNPVLQYLMTKQITDDNLESVFRQELIIPIL